jgi:protein-disulfide isomerase
MPADWRRNRNLIVAIAGALAVAVVLIVLSLALSGGDEGPTSSGGAATLVDDMAQSGTVLGSPDANVTLLQYEDIQCPFCRTYTRDAFPSIVEQYVKSGQLKIDFRGLEFLGEDSNEALRLVLAAARQDRAWQVVELLYERQGAENSGWVTDELLRAIATDAGLDVEQALADAPSTEITQEIAALADEATARNVTGTPAFFLQIGDDEPYSVTVPELTAEAFQPILADALRS